MPQLLRGITAGLLMLGKGRAVELMDAIGAEVRKLIEPGAGVPDALRLERIADAIVSIEYYMETLQNGRADPWYMLDNAEMCIKALAADAAPRVPNVELPDGRADAESQDPRDARCRMNSRARGAAILRAQAAHSSGDRPAERGAVDPQFLELFIEEAKEEIASIQQTLPAVGPESDGSGVAGLPAPQLPHLKGSGRMVGARSIAEFAWSIENLLNRIIDKTLSRTPGMMGLLRNAVAALPQLVEQLESGRQNSVPVEAIMSRAFAYADGREAEQLGAALAPEDRADVAAIPASWRRPRRNRRQRAVERGRLRRRCRRSSAPRRSPPAAARGTGGRGRARCHGSAAARDLQQGNLEPSGGDSRAICASAPASRRRTICRSPCTAPSIP